MGAGALTDSRLRRLAQPPPRPAPDEFEHCDMCAEPIGPRHRHLIDVESRQLICACQACSLLFDRKAASGGHYRRVPDRRRALAGFEMPDVSWASLRIPVEMAFFFHATPAGRVVAFYPGPMGATESALELEAWEELVAANPVLSEMEPDVEALLVNRAGDAREHFLVPVDDCYRLVGLIRGRWRGFTGGAEVWEEIGRFFEDLGQRCERPRRTPRASVAAPDTSDPAASAAGPQEE